MSMEVTSLLENLMVEPALPSWHETARRDLGIPDNCAAEALLCLQFQGRQRPLVFVLNARDLHNTLTAVSEYIREAFHPLYGHGVNLVVFDLMPPLDRSGSARGMARRWVLDATNHMLVFASMQAFLRKLAPGL